MTRTKSAEEVRREYLDTMGPELGPLFHRLSIETTWLNWRWQQYVLLYGGKQGRLDILNQSAPFFFFIIQETLWHDALLGIARLSGPSETGGKRNLAVRRLLPLLDDEALKDEVTDLIADMDGACAFALELRNRHIAHRDLDLALGHEARPLPLASQEKLEVAIESIVAVLNRVQRHYQDATTAYNFSGQVYDADALLHVLRDGLRREELRRSKLENGEYDPVDWNDDLPPI